MAKSHGARQQKKAAHKKAKRTERKTELNRRTSMDPTVRLKGIGSYPVLHSLVSTDLWTQGIGYVVLCRQESEGACLWASFLVDLYCMGVKNAFWDAGSTGDFRDVREQFEERGEFETMEPASLVKLVEGAVAFAKGIGIKPQGGYKHASKLFAGIDPTTATREFEFGDGGVPHYIRGPYESIAQFEAISALVTKANGRVTFMDDEELGLEDDVCCDDPNHHHRHHGGDEDDDFEMPDLGAEVDDSGDIVLHPDRYEVVAHDETAPPE